jgi:hypothetical protein
MIVDRRFRGAYCLHHPATTGPMAAERTSETSVDNHFTRQYIPDDNSELFISLILYVFRQITALGMCYSNYYIHSLRK